MSAQLQQVAQIMQIRAALGVHRQIFFCNLGSFDTHGSQLAVHASLLGALDTALTSFYQATEELGLAKQVTTFTMSEFSRALQPNSSDGTDHAWGSHHLVLGGAVKGGALYGTFPTLALNGPDDPGGNGRWIPATATSQYGATLATWFGVTENLLPSVFPSLGSFPTHNLGFLG